MQAGNRPLAGIYTAWEQKMKYTAVNIAEI
jgi:hypothetical protein